MSARILRQILLACAALAIGLPSFYCNSAGNSDEKQPTGSLPHSDWLNVYDTSAHYVGMDVCQGCHPDVYETFIKTGMGQSFGRATKEKSAADFSPAHALVYDTALDYYYKPYWQHDTFYIMEYRLAGRDTTHKLVQQVDYVIGSGQHTNSHIFNNNGYFFQAPITFYTQKHRWDMAPGFEKGASSRFRRMIQAECMTCHNGYPDFVKGSENRYNKIMTGIDCERCHGPGSLHVYTRQNNPPHDTSQSPDYTIVNPRRLPTKLQNNVCQRCHLQGIAVLNDGKTFFDFRPGMHLSEVMNVFMPEYEGAQDKMIMASHVERMKKSRCYVSSGKMSCITCHNPHISVKFTPRAQYLTACQGCHSGSKQCSELPAARAAKHDDCVTCHMPRNSSIDIPHVAVTDHYIRKRPLSEEEATRISAFLGMRCFNNDKPDAITRARGFMEFYERYTPTASLLDSALHYLALHKTAEQQKQNRDFIRAYYLQKRYDSVIALAAVLQPVNVTDAWTTYRIGEACYQAGQRDAALPWYKRATDLWPYARDFANKYGTCLLSLGHTNEALNIFTRLVTLDPNHTSAHTNLGYIYMQQGNMTMAYDHMRRAEALDPDYEQNLINLAVWYYRQQQPERAHLCLQHLVQKHPDNEQAKAMLADLGG